MRHRSTLALPPATVFAIGDEPAVRPPRDTTSNGIIVERRMGLAIEAMYLLGAMLSDVELARIK